MPDRMIREGLKESDRVAQLTWAAEVFFIHLKLTVDDNGVHPADPELLKAKCFPKRPQVRTTDIVRWIAECEKADLIVAYDAAADSKRYLQVLRFGQRLKWSRGKYPLPQTGPPDAPGQLRLIPAADPPPRPPPMKRSEEKRERAANPPPTPALTDEQWLDELQRARPDVDVRAELRACLRRKPNAGRKYFETEWLARAEPRLTAGAPGASPALVGDPEPEAWRQHLKDAYEGQEWAESAAACTWATLPAHWRQRIARELQASTPSRT